MVLMELKPHLLISISTFILYLCNLDSILYITYVPYTLKQVQNLLFVLCHSIEGLTI